METDKYLNNVNLSTPSEILDQTNHLITYVFFNVKTIISAISLKILLFLLKWKGFCVEVTR